MIDGGLNIFSEHIEAPVCWARFTCSAQLRGCTKRKSLSYFVSNSTNAPAEVFGFGPNFGFQLQADLFVLWGNEQLQNHLQRNSGRGLKSSISRSTRPSTRKRHSASSTFGL